MTERPDAPWAELESSLVDRTDELPPAWIGRGNRVLTQPGAHLPAFAEVGGFDLPSESVFVLRSTTAGIAVVHAAGCGNRLFIGDDCNFVSMGLAVLDGAMISFQGRCSAGRDCTIDARNGGSVTIGEYGLWGNGVRAVTDDMHMIFDCGTGERINRFGSTVTVNRHVWIGLDALILPGASIGESSVVAARAVVSSELAAHTISAGVPARVVRENVNWHIEDRPPSQLGW